MTANRIRQLRAVKGWSQEELGQRIGSNKYRISRLESEEQRLDLDTALKIAGALEVSVADVIGIEQIAGADDAEEYAPGPLDSLARLADPARHQALYTVKTRVIDELGIEPGDVLLVDKSPQAVGQLKQLAVVLCRCHLTGDVTQGFTFLRQFVPPNLLITNSRTANQAPINTTAASVNVIGVVMSRHHSVTPLRGH